MNTPSILVGPAGFQGKGDFADTADDTLSMHAVTGACHSIVLLADHGLTGEARIAIAIVLPIPA